MTKEVIDNVAEGNKLIAEFMGGQVMPDGRCGGYTKMKIPEWAFRLHDFDSIRVGGYGYNKSWDWLMPVVQKIFSLKMESFDVYVLYVEDSLRTADIKEVWESVKDFIENHKPVPA